MAELKVYAPGEGEKVDLGPMVGHIKTTGKELRDNIAVAEWNMTPGGFEPPPHVHEHTDEVLVVTEGTIEVLDGKNSYKVSAGAVVVVPAGAVHGLNLIGGEPAKCLTINSPGSNAIESFKALEALFAGGAPTEAQMAETFSKIDMKPVLP